MSSARLQIMNAIASALGTATGLVVYRNLDYALEDNQLPALVIERGSDMPDEQPAQYGVLDHVVLLKVTVLVAGSNNPEATADAHEVAIHAALMSANVLGGFQVEVRWAGAPDPSFDLGDCGAFPQAYYIAFRTKYSDLEH